MDQKNSCRLIVGAQWGDEGKGKIVDELSSGVDIVARYQGGPNAGHTVEVGDNEYVFHVVPSGIVHAECVCVMGHGMVIDVKSFKAELDMLSSHSINPQGRLLVSSHAHLILPWHQVLDAAQEKARSAGGGKIGTTGRGIGPAYVDKYARLGVRAGDVQNMERFLQLLYASLHEANRRLNALGEPLVTEETVESFAALALEVLLPFVADTVLFLNQAVKSGKKVLIESAQGVMLDVDLGTYPYVTSSNPTPGGACTGLGLPPTAISGILGVIKAYNTRVGSGPFPSEVREEFLAEHIRQVCHEYGATTKRPRRPGWLDLVQLRYALMVSGCQALVMTKADVLGQAMAGAQVQVCTSYRLGNKELTEWPDDLSVLEQCEPVYDYRPGWPGEEVAGVTDYDELPGSFRSYVEFVENQTGVPVKVISTGPQRGQTIIRRDVQVPGLDWFG